MLQTSIAAAFTNAANANGNSADPSQAVTTTSGDATIGALIASQTPTAESQTRIMISSGQHGSATYALSGGTSDTHSWTLSATTWGFAGIRVNQTVSGPGSGSDASSVVFTESSTNIIFVSLVEETS